MSISIVVSISGQLFMHTLVLLTHNSFLCLPSDDYLYGKSMHAIFKIDITLFLWFLVGPDGFRDP